MKCNVETLTFDWLSSDNLLLCQFMVNHELRQGDYLVAYEQQQIVAAAILFQQAQHQAQVDVVVAPEVRGVGVGSRLVQQLIEQANDLPLHRLVAHSAQAFWIAQGFSQVNDNQFALVLPKAGQDLVSLWHRGIPMSEFMALEITSFDQQSLNTRASMASSINVHQSMFAGAIYSQAVLTGWGLLHLALIRYGLNGSIVLANGEVNYRRPITESPVGRVNRELCRSDFASLIDGKNCSIEMVVELAQGQGGKTSATFVGRYVILPPATN